MAGQLTGKSVYNVHRLDSKTSGVMILAFSPATAKALTGLFEERMVRKEYVALVKGDPGAGTFDNKVVVKKKSRFKKPAITHYRTLNITHTKMVTKEGDPLKLSLVLLQPETGRWHQLRQHLANNRTDIIGDTHHGDFSLNRQIFEKTGVKRLMLHASQLSFIHPGTGKNVIFKSELPEEFSRLVRNMEEDPDNAID
ncbi:MAG: pseudouridine synthase [Bacteroidales bacterium]|nr:pseudouridine synthase [Bacteroidales bacterium]